MKAFSDVQSYWTAFTHRYQRAVAGGRESITTVTRDTFMIPMLEALGYGAPDHVLQFRRTAIADDQSFVISHSAGGESSAPPINIVSTDDKLDERGTSRRSAHSSVQEYLNVSDCVWGIVTNGNKLRLLRNSSRLAKPRYIEFDLAGMMESSVYSDFHLLYRLLHRTRLPNSSADASECWLEKYYLDGVEQGSRVRDRLRDGVVDALKTFGNAFLIHEKSGYLRDQIAAGHLTAAAYYRQLLRLVYRLLFLMVAEERRLMFPESRENEQSRAIFSEHYGVNRLRARAERYIGDDPEIDLWESLKQTFRVLRDDSAAHMLGMAALDGELFGPLGCPHLDGGGNEERTAFCRNDQLLRAIHSLSTFDDEGIRRRVNFAALDVEELGSVYESLLEYHPQLSASPAAFDLTWGSERKTTGSYYTPPDLVRELINSALIPVMMDRLKPARMKEERERAILSMRVVDPAAGSGHFLLAASRQMGRELAKIRTGEEEPPPTAFRHAVRDVIRECIHAVDKNPLAVDLCKVALWIEGHNAGQPLSFLDHHVKCGDSLIGVFNLKVLEEGIPDGAYKAVEGDDKAAAKHYRQLNRETKKNQPTFPQLTLPADVVTALGALSRRDERTPEDVAVKERQYMEMLNSPAMQRLENASNAWTAAFFVPLSMPEVRGRDLVPTSSTVWEKLSGRQIYGLLDGEIAKSKLTHSFFHWPVEFPDVFTRGGFDVVLGNPPWERIKLQQKEFFASREPEIAQAPNKAAREKLIKELPKRKPELAREWAITLQGAESQSAFARESQRFPLCGRGDVNTYSIFAELALVLAGNTGRAGIIVPSGIATDDTTKLFFRDLMETHSVVSLYDFENRKAIFSAVHRSYKFCLLTMAPHHARNAADFFFFALSTDELKEPNRHVSLSGQDIALLNPNTRTCPILRTRRDALINRDIYSRVPLLIRDGDMDGNLWRLSLIRMFHSSDDSSLFRTESALKRDNYTLVGPHYTAQTRNYVRLYESKMIHQFDHRWATYDSEDDTRDLGPHAKNDPQVYAMPRYWLEEQELTEWLSERSSRDWLVGWRGICRNTDERTAIASIIPLEATSDSFQLIFSSLSAGHMCCLVASLNSFVFDYCARQKLSGTKLTYYLLKQLPVLPPLLFEGKGSWNDNSLTTWISSRVAELSYTAWDLQTFAQELNYGQPPFRWDENRRFLIRCELDAAFFHLYGIARDDTDYIMETFSIVKRKEEERFGEYRTKRVILEIYDEMAEAIRTGRPYQTRVDPPPGDPRAAHQITTRGKEDAADAV
jgi:hypothetical protein